MLLVDWFMLGVTLVGGLVLFLSVQVRRTLGRKVFDLGTISVMAIVAINLIMLVSRLAFLR